MPPNFETQEQLGEKGKPRLQISLQDTMAQEFDSVPFTGPETTAWWTQMMDTYLLLQGYVDEQIGRVFSALASRPAVAANTVIIFTSDHGEQLFDHWMLGKSGYFDQSAHIPLIIRDPRAASTGGRGKTVSEFTESIDIMPTLLELVGLSPPRNCDGKSLLPFCAGKRPAHWRDEVHWSFDFRDIQSQSDDQACPR